MLNSFKRLWHRFGLRPASPVSAVHKPNKIKPQIVDWTSLLTLCQEEWQIDKDRAQGPRILIATNTGSYEIGTAVESLLAIALTLRGARVHFLLCDEALSACSNAVVTAFGPKTDFARQGVSLPLCHDCIAAGLKVYEPLGLPIHRLSEFVLPTEYSELALLASSIEPDKVRNFTWEGIAVGEHAYAGAIRFFATGNLAREMQWQTVQRQYLYSALKTAFAVRRLLMEKSFDVICLNHGIYVPQGIVNTVALQTKTRLVTWNPSYRSRTFIFSHTDTYHHTLLDEPVENWESMHWSAAHEADILEYLKSRWQGTRDWIWFHEKPEEDLAEIVAKTGLDLNRPCIGLLTNVMWDAQLHYRANAFPNMLEWIIQTIRYFIQRPDIQLVIRIHPAEVRGTLPSRQPLASEIEQYFPDLPKNIVVVPPENQISTYALMELCSTVIIYGTKTGVELVSQGTPVIVAGEAWIRNKGLTLDAASVAEYFELLDRLPLSGKMSPDLIQRARKYAYHFFFRRMIPLEMMEPTGGWPPFRVGLNNLDALKPGVSLGLDVICNGILNGTEFIYPAEHQQLK